MSEVGSDSEPGKSAMAADSSVGLPPVQLSSGRRIALRDAFDGTEPRHMTPLIAADLAVLDEPLACVSGDVSQVEVDTLGRSLDILAPAVVPGAGEVRVAIENQYRTADPDHFDRLVGWYMPETGAEMGALIPEDFEPQLIRSVREGRIIRPLHGWWIRQEVWVSRP